MPEQYTITGTIAPADGADRAGMKVQAFDRDLPSLERCTGGALSGDMDQVALVQVFASVQPGPSHTAAIEDVGEGRSMSSPRRRMVSRPIPDFNRVGLA